jgi:hypothetical protein
MSGKFVKTVWGDGKSEIQKHDERTRMNEMANSKIGIKETGQDDQGAD